MTTYDPPEYRKYQGHYQGHLPPIDEIIYQQRRINELEKQLVLLQAQIVQLTERLTVIERLETQVSILANAIMED